MSAPRPETADLHRRILAAAIRNGHTPESFARVCMILGLKERMRDLMDRVSRIGNWVVVSGDGSPQFHWKGDDR